MNSEKEHVAELLGIEEREKVSFLLFRSEEEGELKVSMFKDAVAPPLDKDATYRFRTVQNNGYVNLAPIWSGSTKTGYKIEKIAERAKPASRNDAAASERSAEAAAPARSGSLAREPKLDARELRISRLSLTSSSCIIAAALINEGKMASAKEAEEFVLAFARKLEQYAVSPEAV